MNTLNEKLNLMRDNIRTRKAKIMIIGLGSVGGFLLDYLLSTNDENIEIFVVGRNGKKMESDVNIARVASLIRGQNKTNVKIIAGVDLNNVEAIANAIRNVEPDIILNSSRAFSGLKYGSISWANVRAYGIWTPLAITYTKNIMSAYEKAESSAIVINTSYSDAVIPWLKSAGKAYPDFGSGNVNHLIPRIKFAVSEIKGIEDYWNIDVTFAVAHFHDVCISKEGQTEGVDMLIDIRYMGEKVEVDLEKVFSLCKIPMPVDAKRNMMNASSNYFIITSILAAVREGEKRKVHSPGFDGNIGGYPVIIDGSGSEVKCYVDDSYFSMDDMINKNRESLYLDGVEDVKNATLFYTDELITKVKNAFGVDLVKSVSFEEIDKVAQVIIKSIIEPQLEKKNK